MNIYIFLMQDNSDHVPDLTGMKLPPLVGFRLSSMQVGYYPESNVKR
jgi:hypothetical protein